MTVLITGCSNGAKMVEKAITDSGFDVKYLITGEAKGVEKAAQSWAKRNKIPVFILKEDDYLDNSSALILVWDGKDPIHAKILETAKHSGKLVHETIV